VAVGHSAPSVSARTVVSVLAAAIITAVATVVLASVALAQIKASKAQSAASRVQSEASTRQAEASEQALSTQTTPLLSDVPYGIPIITSYRLVRDGGQQSIMQSFLMGRREPVYSDGSEISAYIDENGAKDVSIDVPFRNVAPGTAIIDTVVFRTAADIQIAGASETPVLPAGEITTAGISLLPSAELYEAAKDVVATHEAFSVLVAYSDAAGVPRGAIRLDVASEAAPEDETWFVRQVHWGDSIAEVRDQPRLSSRVHSLRPQS
jgi:hypothetical protein